jgi:catechol-2,3-dioxygenase
VRPSRLHHLALGARDVDSLAEFYHKVVGLEEHSRHEEPGDGSLRSVWLKLGEGAILMIEKSDEPSRPPLDGRRSGLFLFALSADEETVEKRCKALEMRGFFHHEATAFSRYFHDPEGNRFAFSTYPFPE